MIGDIVFAPYWNTDLSGNKVRPVLVVADVQDSGERDWVVCEITSSGMARASAIAIDPVGLASGRLHAGSVIRPNRLTTLNESLLGTVSAQLTPTKLSEVLAAVRSLF